MNNQKVNILLVDDHPAKLLSYQVILRELGENLLVASSAQEAFDCLNRTEIAVVLVDVYMPELDGFELARMIRDHPRFQHTAIILISAVLLTDVDFLRGYQHGAVDYISVPVIPEILRAKVKVFADLYRKTKQLEHFNQQLEVRVAERTAALEATAAKLRSSENKLRLALLAANMGWWEYDIRADQMSWSQNLVTRMGFAPEMFKGTLAGMLSHVHPDDRTAFLDLVQRGDSKGHDGSCEIRFVRPDQSTRWALAAGHIIHDSDGRPTHFAGVDLDITERKQAEDRQELLVRELDHRAKNLLAVVQSIVRLTKGASIADFVNAVEGRILALARVHSLVSEARWASVDLKRLVEEEVAPFSGERHRINVADSPAVPLTPAAAQSLAMALHELLTNAVKYGALSSPEGRIELDWSFGSDALAMRWMETGGPATTVPKRPGLGLGVIHANLEGLNGHAAFDWLPTGLYCELSIPRNNSRALGELNPEGPRAATSLQLAELTPSAAPKVLLIEDEPLVAALTKDLLVSNGYAVVGPIGTVDVALAAARECEISAALLDINLHGNPSYSVAEVLAARKVPFAFLTGYSSGAIDPNYSRVPVLQKPLDLEAFRIFFGGVETSLGSRENRDMQAAG
jgi:PAS domain S-box-containing protein